MFLKGITALSVVLAAVLSFFTGSFQSLQWLWVLPVSFVGCWVALFLIAFAFVWIVSLLVDQSKVQEKDDPFYRWVANLCADAIVSVLRMRVCTTGMENVPQDGRFLLVCNHLHLLDPVALLFIFRKNQIAFISKKENSEMFIIGKLMHKVLCQTLDRDNDREALKTIIRCINLIKEDQVSIAVFPEGYTSKDHKLHPFRNGVFKIAQKANVPIVVCTIQNTQNVFHNLLRLKSTQIPLHLVGVIPAEELKGVTTVEIGERVHKLMADDLGPENVLNPASTDTQNT